MPASPIKIAVLDDYQGVALKLADWSSIQERAEVTVFRDNITDQKALAERLAPFDVICVMRERTPLNGALLQQLTKLKFLVTSGYRNASIDTETLERLGIPLGFTGSTSHAPTEMTWALILAAMRQIPSETANMRAGDWQKTVGKDLNGATIGLVGLGKTGAAMARIAKAFEMNVIAWSQNLTTEKAAEGGATAVSKEELFKQADVVSVHLVLSDRSRGIVGAPELAAMKRDAWIVNTSRGPLIDKDALIAALKAGQIAGAALDVYDVEPPPKDDPFRSLPNVIATPHLGFVTEKTYRIMYGGMVENIETWLAAH